VTESDPLSLVPLFEGGGEAWLPLLKPVLERALPEATTFIGPNRAKSIVPVRELTFQALKPHPPGRWRVVIFGQNPYPRLESATGIAMFDNTFADWNDGQFGKVVSMRCIIKAACMQKHGVTKAATVGDVRKLLETNAVVTPPRWFQAVLAQGVLLLNASLTASADDSLSTSRHTRFWKPVVERIVEEILAARGERGVVFVWWGSHAKSLRKVIEGLQEKHPEAAVRHVDHCNPAAMGEAFCEGDPLGVINGALAELGMDAIDWLPRVGWDGTEGEDREESERLGDFIEKTRELHKLYLERLQDVGGETLVELDPIGGVLALPLPTLAQAMAPLLKLFPPLGSHVARAQEFARKVRGRGALTEHETGALFLYTVQSVLYRQLNAALRDPDRTKATPWLLYLRLFLSATRKLSALAPPAGSLWRGVAKDLRRDYSVGRSVTWWGVSSCTPSLSVARSFLGSSGGRTLFEITPRSAVSIRSFSAFTGEDEYVLAPGARLDVLEVKSGEGGVWHVRLAEGPIDVWSDGVPAPAPSPRPEPAAVDESQPKAVEPGPEPPASPGLSRTAILAIGLAAVVLVGLLAWLAR